MRRPVRYAWLRIKDDIQDIIFQRKYRPGDRIATVEALAKKHGVSTTTVRQAIDELASEGVLEVRQGRGTTVAPPKMDYDPLRGFQEQAKELGGEPRTEIYQTAWQTPHADVVRALGLRSKALQTWEVTRLHYLDDDPVMLEATAFLRKVATRFLGDSQKLKSLFRTLREEYGDEGWGISVASVHVTGERTFSDLLGIPRRIAFYFIERVITIGEVPSMVSRVVLRSDRFQLRFHTQRNGSDGRKRSMTKGGGVKADG